MINFSFPVISAYDPSARTSGSIDPLGALRTYGSLAELLLPGLTTLTNRARYLSVLCRGLAAVEKYGDVQAGPAGVRVRRKDVEPFERLWALACADMKLRGVEGAADQLRGISRAEKLIKDKEFDPVHVDFRLLLSQGRAGGMAAYWTLLRQGRLVEEDGRLSPDGAELAEKFPEPPEGSLENLCSSKTWKRVRVSRESLKEWGKTVHLGKIPKSEKEILRTALLADSQRAIVFRALGVMSAEGKLPKQWRVRDVLTLGKVLDGIAVDDGGSNLSGVIQAICAFERLHEALLRVFDTLRWKATCSNSCALNESILDAGLRSALATVRKRAEELRDLQEEMVDKKVQVSLKEFSAFYGSWIEGRDDIDLCREVIKRHEDTQSGKTDGGAPKLPWLKRGEKGLLRPHPKRQLRERPSAPNGSLLTHPYRLEQFARMLQEVGELQGRPRG